ncbi:hypothetical protein FJZ53_01255 [Candidatus Woesearchaeota archaeon]|nr:hypothetical protein [Candidatus Woesearchaeota archaeon]
MKIPHGFVPEKELEEKIKSLTDDNVKKQEAIDALLNGYKTGIERSISLPNLREYYVLASDIAKTITYTKEDISDFCSEKYANIKTAILKDFGVRLEGQFREMRVREGLYVSALVNKIIKKNEKITIWHESGTEPLPYLGYNHSKGILEVKGEGGTGDYLGAHMTGGKIIAKYTTFWTGYDMRGGKIMLNREPIDLHTEILRGGEIWVKKKKIYPNKK